MLLPLKEYSLSPRQQQLVQLIGFGSTDKEIAWCLKKTNGEPLSYGTVKVYMCNLFKKLGLNRYQPGNARVILAMWARCEMCEKNKVVDVPQIPGEKHCVECALPKVLDELGEPV